MKGFLIGAMTAVMFSSVAFADAVVVPAPPPGAVIEHRSDADHDAVKKKVIIHHGDDCSSRTVKKTNDAGDSVSHTESNC